VAVTFRCFCNFLLIRRWILEARSSETDAVTVVLGVGEIAGDGAFATVGAGKGCAKAVNTSATEHP